MGQIYVSNFEGYILFGLQNGRECYCGNSFGKYGQAPEDDCHMQCPGDNTVRCGGSFRNSVYSKVDQIGEYS